MRKILVVFIISIYFAGGLFAQQKFKEITTSDLFQKRTFSAKGVFGLRSMNDGLHYTTQDFRNQLILKHSYSSSNVTDTLCRINQTGLSDVSDYELSGDETKIILLTNRKGIYRRSFTAQYFIYDIKSKQLQPLSDKKEQQLATFSPDGSKIAFIFENNIYYKDLITAQETQVTFDGKKNNILNGLPDWVYEEEFGFNKAFDWSADSKRLAYIRFNETNVKTFDMTVYAGLAPKLAQNILYPENRQWKYPKAGESNSIVNVFIYDLQTTKSVQADIGIETDIYIPRIKWTNQVNQLSIVRLNRLQNKMDLLFADASSGNTKIVYTDINKYYIEENAYSNISFLADNQFVLMSERDGFRHLYLCNASGNQIQQVTKGNWDVTEYYGYDEKNKLFYYQSSEEHPTKRAVYAIDLKGKKKVKLSAQEGTNRATFSKTFRFYINNFSNSNTPPYYSLHDSNAKLIRVLEDNSELSGKVKDYGGVIKSFFSFKTSEGVELNAFMVKPANFDPNKKYPVLIHQYSGPNSQLVADRWEFTFNNLIAQKDYILACVDPRGTGYKGEEFRKITYLQLGKYETIDLIEFAKYLGKQQYIDASRIGIWGWSYGGYMALLCMTKGAEYFKAGISVAPVTNWRYYDNIYTERFMRTPQENAQGYDDNSPINHVDKLKGKLLLVHGTADDNVHVQNSMEMAEALVQANKQFQQFYYTNRDHSIIGGNTRIHLYDMMIEFLLKNL
jgi:dipeptidyl-peptidase 4